MSYRFLRAFFVLIVFTLFSSVNTLANDRLELAAGESVGEQIAIEAMGEKSKEKLSHEEEKKQEHKALKHLIEKLENEDSREKLVITLKELLEAQEKSMGKVKTTHGAFKKGIYFINDQVSQLSSFARTAISDAKELPSAFEQVKITVEKDTSKDALLMTASALVGALVLAYIIELFVKLIFRRFKSNVHSQLVDKKATRHFTIIPFSLITLIEIAAGVAVMSFAVHHWFAGQALATEMSMYVVIALFIAQFIRRITLFLLSPKKPEIRYLHLSNEMAKSLSRKIHFLAFWSLISFTIIDIFGLLGFPSNLVDVALRASFLISLVLALHLILSFRVPVSNWFRAEINIKSLRSRIVLEWLNFVADTWHIWSCLALICLYFMWAINIEGSFAFLGKNFGLTAIILIAAHMLSMQLIYWGNRCIKAILDFSSEIKKEISSNASAIDVEPKLQVFDSTVHTLIYIVATFLIFSVWGIHLFDLLARMSPKDWTSIFINLFVVLILSMFVWELIKGIINYHLQDKNINGKVIKPSLRSETLLPVVRSVVKWFIIFITTLIVLSELGINISALLAGFGILGLAVAMGSQRLAQDIVTGVFILMENSLSIGDVVTVAGVSGQVEGFSIRTLRIRNISGEIHTVPYSAIGEISNLSRDHSLAFLEVGFYHGEDLAKVSQIFHDVGKAMQEDPNRSPKILSDLEIVGVSKITDTATHLFAIMKTEPDPYKVTGQEFNRRIRIAFNEKGIKVPTIQQAITGISEKSINVSLTK